MAAHRKLARRLRRFIQTLSLGFFLYLLFRAVWPLAQALPSVNFFLRLDPLAALGASLAARQWIADCWPTLVLLILTVLFGRFFCGYLCPLGTTLDIVRRFVKPKRKAGAPPHLRAAKIKYLILAAVLAAAVGGFNAYHWGSPLSLITRFYGLLIYPLLLALRSLGLEAGQMLAGLWGEELPSFFYLNIKSNSYNLVWPAALIFLIIFWLERKSSRFWCRYLCPAGALLGLASFRPLWRRRVQKCAGCGHCAEECPTGAIDRQDFSSRPSECLVCRTCADVCPTQGLAFRLSDKNPMANSLEAPASTGPKLPSRRAFVIACGAGLTLAGANLISAPRFIQAAGQCA